MRNFGAGTLEASDPAIDRLRFQEAMAALPQAIRDLPQPVIAAVNGPCVGAGFALCLASDIRICSTARHIRQRRDSARAVRRRDGDELSPAPDRRNQRRRRLDADRSNRVRPEADRRGLVSELVEPDRLADRALELAAGIAELPPLRSAADEAGAAGEHRRGGPRRGHGAGEPQPGADSRHRRGGGTAQAVTPNRRTG